LGSPLSFALSFSSAAPQNRLGSRWKTTPIAVGHPDASLIAKGFDASGALGKMTACLNNKMGSAVL